MTKETIKLSEVPRRIRRDFGVEITYRRLYSAVLDGKVPAHKDDSGHGWLINDDDLPEIAEKLKPVNIEDLAPPDWDGKIIA